MTVEADALRIAAMRLAWADNTDDATSTAWTVDVQNNNTTANTEIRICVVRKVKITSVSKVYDAVYR